MGADILAQITRRPQWQHNLEATQQRIACREERRDL